jgi:hypothetical protein
MSMNTDVWFADRIADEWVVRDENRLIVARCGRRRDDAHTVARDHNAHEKLLTAARNAATMLAHIRRGGSYGAVEYLDREQAICASINEVLRQ